MNRQTFLLGTFCWGGGATNFFPLLATSVNLLEAWLHFSAPSVGLGSAAVIEVAVAGAGFLPGHNFARCPMALHTQQKRWWLSTTMSTRSQHVQDLIKILVRHCHHHFKITGVNAHLVSHWWHLLHTAIFRHKSIQMVLQDVHGHLMYGDSGFPGAHVLCLQSYSFHGEDASSQRLCLLLRHQQYIPHGIAPSSQNLYSNIEVL